MFFLIFLLLCLFVFLSISSLFLFFFNDTATSEIYTLSLHDALPIFRRRRFRHDRAALLARAAGFVSVGPELRSEEHTSELQSLRHLVCRLLLEKKKKKKQIFIIYRIKNI